LISILLPALGAARKAAQAIRCQSNLKQNQLALFSYAEDHEGYMPPPLINGGFSKDSWTPRLVDHGYISTDRAAFCPSYLPERYDESKYCSYGMRVPHSTVSRQASGSTNYSRELKIAAVDGNYGQPSEYIHLGDTFYKNGTILGLYFCFYGYEVVEISLPSSGPYIHARHQNAANVSFLDGHGEALPSNVLESSTEVTNWKIVNALDYGQEP
jgi:prepilin-type processing-associated H-X9-DG protein